MTRDRKARRSTMRLSGSSIALFALLGLAPTGARGQPSANATLCEMAAAPYRFAGLHLVVRADVSLDVDAYSVFDPRCPDRRMAFAFGAGAIPGSRLNHMMYELPWGVFKDVLLYGHLRIDPETSYLPFVAEDVLAFPTSHVWHRWPYQKHGPGH